MKKLLALLFALLAAPAGAQVIPSGPVGSLNYWGVGGLSQVLNPGLAGQCLTTQGTGSAPVWVNCQVSSLALLPSINTNQFYGNVSGQFSPPVGVDVNTILNTVGYDIARPPPVESIIYKSNVGPLFNWQALFPGTAGSLLTSGGPTNPPFWAPNQIQANLSGICTTVGAVLYFDTPSTQWKCLNPGTAGQLLQTGGAGANPSWGSVAAAQMPALTGDVTSSAGTVATIISANAVTNAKLAQVPANTEKCNSTGGVANPQDCARPWVAVTDPSIGAKCDGVTDDTTALQAWASGIVAGGNYIIPNSICIVKGPLVFALVGNVTIAGAGPQSELLYAGATTTGNIFTFGTSSTSANCGVSNFKIHDITFFSSTVMTSGTGVYFGHLCHVDMQDVRFGEQFTTNGGNWWNAVQIYGGGTWRLSNYWVSAQNIGEIVSGDGTNNTIDIFQWGGLISHSGAIGLNLAGGNGGFVIGETDILLNGTYNVVVDQSVSGTPNVQIFFRPKTFVDATGNGVSGGGVGFYLNDAGNSSSLLQFDGAWLASATSGVDPQGVCFLIASGVQYQVYINGGWIGNCHNDGIRNTSTATKIYVNGARFHLNTAFGFNNTVANNNIFLNAGFDNNTSGNFTGVNQFSSFNYTNDSLALSSQASLKVGIGGSCGLWYGTTSVTPGDPASASAGCTYGLGTSGFPFATGVINSLQLNGIVANSGVQITGTAPTSCSSTGTGTGPSCAFEAGSSDSNGGILITTGTSPGSSGTFTINFAGTFGTNAPTCLFEYSDRNTAWNASAAAPHLTAISTSLATGSWNNNAVALTASSVYSVAYHCFGK